MGNETTSPAKWKFLLKFFKNLGFVEGNVDPCLYIKKTVKHVVYVAPYIINNLMVGDVVAIEKTISALKSNQLELKIMDG